MIIPLCLSPHVYILIPLSPYRLRDTKSVTLGDEAAKRRGVQKSVLERAAPPTFDVCVEMVERNRWRVHADVGAAVDSILAGEDTAMIQLALVDIGSYSRDGLIALCLLKSIIRF